MVKNLLLHKRTSEFSETFEEPEKEHVASFVAFCENACFRCSCVANGGSEPGAEPCGFGRLLIKI